MQRVAKLLAGLWCCLCVAGSAQAQAPASKVLFVSQSAGFTHAVVKRAEPVKLSVAEVALTQLGETSKLFQVNCTKDCAADFTRENLQKYDIVAFYTTGDLPITPENMDYFLNTWLKTKGHGVLGIHSAMDTLHNNQPYWDMIGGVFTRHPWTQNSKVTITNLEPTNLLTKPFGEAAAMQEEIYMYKNWQPEKVRVLMSLDYSKSDQTVKVGTEHGYHVPVVWIKQYGEGRVYCNNMGHRPQTWTNTAFLDSLTNAVRWIRGEIEVDATPNPDVSRAQEAKSKADFEAGKYPK